ncbi:hypothetical protein GEMRC1_003756 [Eukaryota sp. GEM-RC1]
MSSTTSTTDNFRTNGFLTTPQTISPIRKLTPTSFVHHSPVEEDVHHEISDSDIGRDKPNIPWDSVAGLIPTKEELTESVIIPFKFPHLFRGKGTPWKGILLHGPPGTGKSYIAKTLSTETDSTLFSVSCGILAGKSPEQSERTVRRLFTLARERKPSIIFIDEIDGLCSGIQSDSLRRLKMELLVQMQGIGDVSDGIVVLGATSCPWKIDSSVRRWFEKRIYIPLPEAEARTEMLKNQMESTIHTLVDRDFIDLGEQTEGYSASDIYVLVRSALIQPVRSLLSATHFKKSRSSI